MIGVTILGATGSIGVNTLDVLNCHRDRFRVVALTANRNAQRLLEQCVVHRPAFAVIADTGQETWLADAVHSAGLPTRVLSGADALRTVAALPESDYVMAAIVGAAGLLPTLAAVEAGKRVLLANKEALVMSGRLLMESVARHGAELIPIDSEHNAVFQCMPSPGGRGADAGIRKILLTASGGPFRETPLAKLAHVTPDEACRHPNWDMGRKISVDSATMMNKGLEVIEACWLFATDVSRVEVILHPQSIVHSMVEYEDGSVLAQLGNPDMRTPIAHALGWPERLSTPVAALDLVSSVALEFYAPDPLRYPCLEMAYDAIRAGGTSPTVLNAANEVAVEAFLEGRLPYTGIAGLVAESLAAISTQPADSLETVLETDARTREFARRWLTNSLVSAAQ